MVRKFYFPLGVVLLIFYITIVNFIDRSSISYVILTFKEDFGIDVNEFGLIASAFGLGYLPCSFLSGIVVDRFGTVRTWAFAAGIWSLFMAALSLAEGFWSLFLLRFLLGAAEAIHFPALLRTVYDWLSPHWRARAISLSLTGIPIASIVGAPLIVMLLLSLGWRWMFVVLGGLGLAWAIVWPLLFRGRKPLHHVENEKNSVLFGVEQTDWAKNTIALNFRSLLTPTFITSCYCYFCFAYIVFFALLWLPGYLQMVFHLPLAAITPWIMLPWILSTVLLTLGGWLSDYLMKRSGSSRHARCHLIAGGMALSGLCFFGTLFTVSLESSMILISLGLAFSFVIFAPIYALNTDLFSAQVGTAQGAMSTFFALAGIISPAVTGWTVQKTGDFQAALVCVAIAGLSSAALSFFLHRPGHKRR